MIRLLYEIWEGLLIALRAIAVNKLRTVLTTLGIIIGIVSVTAMATVVSGIEAGFEEAMSSLGTDVLYVERQSWNDGPGSKWWENINRPRMKVTTAAAISRRSKYTEAAAATVRTFRAVSYEGRSTSGTQIIGTTPNFPDVQPVDIADGYFYSDIDDRAARRVAVIGAAIAEELFPVGDPIGKSLRISGQEYRVIGVQVRKGQGADGPTSEDQQVKIPFNAFSNQFGTRYRDVSIQVKVVDPAVMADAKDEITGIVRVARQLDAKEADNFSINEQATLRAQIEPVKAVIYAIGIGLTALSLLVGGIGVMNIMFVSVKERTREIGIRKAVGAKRRSILTQFLIEAIAVSLLGGFIGVLLSFPIYLLVRTFMPAELSFTVIGIAFGICLAIGTVFGLAPAWTAARAEPIDALRYE